MVGKKLTRARAGGFEFEFEQLAELENDVIEAETAGTASRRADALRETHPQEYEEIAKLANLAPAAAIGEYWSRLHVALRGAAKRSGVHAPGLMRNPVDALREHGLIDTETRLLIRELQLLRNRVIHADTNTPTSGEAIRYCVLAARLARQMDEL